MQTTCRLYTLVSGAFTLVISCAFCVIAALFIFLAGIGFWNAYTAQGNLVDALLDTVGLLVVALAVGDVGIYLFEEDVMRDRELRSASEARKSLTKFMVIICISVALEGVAQLSKASHGSTESLLNAAILISLSVLVMLGMGIYQRLSGTIESKDETLPWSPEVSARDHAGARENTLAGSSAGHDRVT